MKTLYNRILNAIARKSKLYEEMTCIASLFREQSKEFCEGWERAEDAIDCLYHKIHCVKQKARKWKKLAQTNKVDTDELHALRQAVIWYKQDAAANEEETETLTNQLAEANERFAVVTK
ncbi:MAG: hypothetical protein LLF76_02665 [Planctomycetaceae bacterium]|nr:hypothetical protein [Planctomycetaceae bacterium]